MKVSLIKRDGIIYGYQKYPLIKGNIVELTNAQIELIDRYAGDIDENFNIIGKSFKRLELEKKIKFIKETLREYDYIGIKIATGRATKEQYRYEIKMMQDWADEINKLQKELDELND